MKKQTLMLTIVALMLSACADCQTPENTPAPTQIQTERTSEEKVKDEKAIVQVALDYIEGWYHGNAAGMDQALHTRLAKRRVTPTGEVWEVDKKWMVKATVEGKGIIENPEKGRKVVTILDATDTMACVKIVSEKFIDYLHLAQDGGRWVIVNVLWDYVSVTQE